ncbi:RHS repeat-associated core domain-containing protein [Luteimonas sp. JM171]|uniref:RHS repeat-associated core domain-containing protein n=1 Tax=Luteimonas sp. JM171 TaxID=1896164 RepID=UPI000B1E975F|nr:RHS repeat-associated core domain-containing protein [Luteimonas sp. JM171]
MSGWVRALIWLLACFIGAVWQPVQAQSVVRYYVTDALGSVVVVTDESGNVMERREYEPYGAQLTPAVQDGPGYTGHVQDAATGLVYMQQRYYDPMLGVFLSVDPVTAYGGDYRHFNRYAYAYNNPYAFTDPDGRVPIAVPIALGVRCGMNAACRAAVATAARKVVQWGSAAVAGYAGSEALNAYNESASSAESSGGNTNPYDGPVSEPVIVVDGDGNAIPVGEGEQVSSSPDGRYQQVKDSSGQPTGVRLDKGGHRTHSDPKAQAPHGHRPGVTDETGNPHLPIEPPKPPPEDPTRGR